MIAIKLTITIINPKISINDEYLSNIGLNIIRTNPMPKKTKLIFIFPV